jgi:hypothetical protein
VTRSRNRLATATLCVALGASLVAAAPASADTSDPCDFGVFIGVRGTDAAPGAGLVHNNRAWTVGGNGDEIVVMSQYFRTNSAPFYMESLNYPAKGGVDYLGSVLEGRNTLIAELNWLATQCGGYLPAVVIGGHSRGAAVALNAFITMPGYPNLTSQARAMVRAVAVFGDPNCAAE